MNSVMVEMSEIPIKYAEKGAIGCSRSESAASKDVITPIFTMFRLIVLMLYTIRGEFLN